MTISCASSLIWLFFFSWYSHKNKSQELEKKIQEFQSIKTNPGRALSNLSQYVHSSFFSNVSAGFGWAYVHNIPCMYVPIKLYPYKISSYSFAKYLTSHVIWVDVIFFISDEEYQKTLKDLEVTKRNLQVHDCKFCFSQSTMEKKILLKMMMATCVIIWNKYIFCKSSVTLEFYFFHPSFIKSDVYAVIFIC